MNAEMRDILWNLRDKKTSGASATKSKIINGRKERDHLPHSGVPVVASPAPSDEETRELWKSKYNGERIMSQAVEETMEIPELWVSDLVMNQTVAEKPQPLWISGILDRHGLYTEAHSLFARLLLTYAEMPERTLTRAELRDLYNRQSQLFPRGDERSHKCTQFTCPCCTPERALLNCRGCGCNPHHYNARQSYVSVLDGIMREARGLVYVCMYTGQVHVCDVQNCDSEVFTSTSECSYVCTLTGLVHDHLIQKNLSKTSLDHRHYSALLAETNPLLESAIKKASIHSAKVKKATLMAPPMSKPRGVKMDAAAYRKVYEEVRKEISDELEESNTASEITSIQSSSSNMAMCSVVKALDNPETDRFGQFLVSEEAIAKAEASSLPTTSSPSSSMSSSSSSSSPLPATAAEAKAKKKIRKLVEETQKEQWKVFERERREKEKLVSQIAGGSQLSLTAVSRLLFPGVNRVSKALINMLRKGKGDFLVSDQRYQTVVVEACRGRVEAVRESLEKSRKSFTVVELYSYLRSQDPMLELALMVTSYPSKIPSQLHAQAATDIADIVSTIVMIFKEAFKKAPAPSTLVASVIRYCYRCLYRCSRLQGADFTLSVFSDKVKTIPDADETVKKLFNDHGFVRQDHTACHILTRRNNTPLKVIHLSERLEISVREKEMGIEEKEKEKSKTG